MAHVRLRGSAVGSFGQPLGGRGARRVARGERRGSVHVLGQPALDARPGPHARSPLTHCVLHKQVRGEGAGGSCGIREMTPKGRPRLR